ncbi:MAG: dTDP-4-dehydrorhamnose reductase [Alphaproteobacteria bacterium]
MRAYLIVGQNGQVSRAMQRSLTARSMPFKVIGSADSDLSKNPEAANAIISKGTYAAVINCSAYTHVDKAETDIQSAEKLNTHAPAHMAKACAQSGTPFLHLSTDYVFDGRKGAPYLPSDQTNPLNVYGRTKAAGEQEVLKAGGQSLIVRTSWVYDGIGANFLTTMLRLAKTHKALSIVDDQIGRPTYAGHLAEACLAALLHMPETPALYHVTNTGKPVSWAKFARAIFNASSFSPEITPISTEAFAAPAPRPAYSVLSTSAFEQTFNHPLQPWQTGLMHALQEHS